MTTFYTRRSAIVSAQRCPRKRYWEYLALPVECSCLFEGQVNCECPICHGTGIQSGIMAERRNVPLLVGSAVHAGLALLLRGIDAETAANTATLGYQRELNQCGLALHEGEESSYVAAEQRALTEALVRLADLRIVPWLLSRYEVIWVERDFERELAPGVVLRGKPDALLREKTSGDLFILSWKTKGGSSLDGRALEDAQHDDQGLSETWLVDGWLDDLPEDIKERSGGKSSWDAETSGVIMIWLLKGERREYPKGSGRYTQSSPLIRGWRKFNDAGQVEYAHSHYWNDGESGHKLGKGWTKFDAWTEPGGVKGWMDKLQEGTVQPDAGDCLAGQFVMSAPYYRQPDDVDYWVTQARYQEDRVHDAMTLGDNPWLYPQHRHSCSYPSRCSFYQICWGAPHVRLDPLANGFVRRRPTVQITVPGEEDNNGE